MSDVNIALLTNNNFNGVKSDSILNCLKNFDICKCLPPYLAHDLFEGLVQDDLMLVLIKLVHEKKVFIQNI